MPSSQVKFPRNRVPGPLLLGLGVAFVLVGCWQPRDSAPPTPEKWHAVTIPTFKMPDLKEENPAPAALLPLIWQNLPAQLEVFPGENYIYWNVENTRGLRIQGNFRLASGSRELGKMQFGYLVVGTEHEHSGTLDAAAGCQVTCPSKERTTVAWLGKEVTFDFPPIPQNQPPHLPDGLRFLQRTRDESGATFLLCEALSRQFVLWVLDTQPPAAKEQLTLQNEGMTALGTKSGFVFGKLGESWILLAVNMSHLAQNSPYDGPFDQLADNYAAETKLRQHLERIYPALTGKIDTYCRYLDGSGRVALKCYEAVSEPKEAISFWKAALASGDPLGKFRDWTHQKP